MKTKISRFLPPRRGASDRERVCFYVCQNKKKKKCGKRKQLKVSSTSAERASPGLSSVGFVTYPHFKKTSCTRCIAMLQNGKKVPVWLSTLNPNRPNPFPPIPVKTLRYIVQYMHYLYSLLQTIEMVLVRFSRGKKKRRRKKPHGFFRRGGAHLIEIFYFLPEKKKREKKTTKIK